MKSIYLLFFLSSLFIFSCESSDSNKLPLDDQGREDFIVFINKFYADSSFQIARIEFPLLGNNPDGSDSPFYWEMENWKYKKAIDTENPDIKLVPLYDMSDVMRERIIIQNRFMIQNLFSLIDNKWYLTEYSGIRDIGYFSGKKKPKNTSDASVDSTTATGEDVDISVN